MMKSASHEVIRFHSEASKHQRQHHPRSVDDFNHPQLAGDL